MAENTIIAVISDSHIPQRATNIPEKFVEKIKQADLTVHCGDFEEKEVYSQLQQYGELIGVKGNCDRFELQNSARFKRNGVDFAVYHGSGIQPRGHHPTLVNAANKLGGDVLFHGHTHIQEAVAKEDKILLNPGSCTGVGGATADEGNPEMMMVELGKKLEVKLLELEGDKIEEEKIEFEL